MSEKMLVLMRHAEPQVDCGYSDFQRQLTPRGELQAHNAGVWLQENIMPRTVLTSAAMRARQTAANLYLPKLISFAEMYCAPAAVLREKLGTLSERTKRAVIVAHNPGIHRLALDLADECEYIEAELGYFSVGALAVFEVTGPWADFHAVTLKHYREP